MVFITFSIFDAYNTVLTYMVRNKLKLYLIINIRLNIHTFYATYDNYRNMLLFNTF